MTDEVLIRGGRLIRSAGSIPVSGASLLVLDGIITATGADAEKRVSDDARLVDLGDAVLAPGLIDAHVHLIWSGRPNALFDAIGKSREELTAQAAVNMQTLLASGVTTVRDCGGIRDVVIPLARAVSEGTVHGPRIVSCGAPVTSRRGHCWFLGCEAEGTGEVRKAVSGMIEAGASFIKVMVTGGGSTPGTDMRRSQYTIEELRAVVSAAHGAGLPVAGHVHGTEGIELAVDAGFDSLEHCTWLARSGGGNDYRPGVVDRMKRRGVYVCKTLAGFQRWPFEEIDHGHRAWEELETMRAMVSAGVEFIAGTDAGIDLTDFAGLSTTLETMSAAGGMTSAAAFASATETAARALGLSGSVGRLEPGKHADIIALESDPQEDIRALRTIRTVLRDGRVVAGRGE